MRGLVWSKKFLKSHHKNQLKNNEQKAKNLAGDFWGDVSGPGDFVESNGKFLL